MYQNNYILKQRAPGHRLPSTVQPPSPLPPIFPKKVIFFKFLLRERHMIIQIIVPHIIMILLKGEEKAYSQTPQ